MSAISRVESRVPLPMVIDTDTASDDAVALILAAASGLADIRAVTTVAGNVPLEQATRNALVTLELAGAGGVPVHAGCERPLVRELATAQHVHGDDGMSNTPLPSATHAVRKGHAVEMLLTLPSEASEPLTLVTLGPLTNLAAALVRDRHLLDRYRHTYCMAGAADGHGNVSATAEYNVWADPEATAIVLDCATPQTVTFVGWDASRQDAVLSPEHQRQLRALGTPLALFADRVNKAVGEWAKRVDKLAGYDLPDPLTMAVVLQPHLATHVEEAVVHVALGDETRGQLLVDRRSTGVTANVALVRRVDSDGFRDLLFRTCATTPVRSPVSAAIESMPVLS